MIKDSDVIGTIVREVTRDESWAMLDEKTRRHLDISAIEFAEHCAGGAYDRTSDPLTMRLVSHLGFLQQKEVSVPGLAEVGEAEAPCEERDAGTEVENRAITREEAWATLDGDTRRYLGIGAAEFARRYNAGEYDDPDNDTRIMRLAFDLEFLQRNEAVTP